MREEIIQTLFEGWCDGKYGFYKKEEADLDVAIAKICDATNPGEKVRLLIDNTLCEVVSSRERQAFIDGFYLCLELLNGNILKTNSEETK